MRWRDADEVEWRAVKVKDGEGVTAEGKKV